MRGVEVHRLCGVDDRSAADGNEGVETPGAAKRDRVRERFICGLYSDAVVQLPGQPACVERVDHHPDRRQRGEDRIGDDQDLSGTELGKVGADFASHANPESHGRSRHLERVVVFCVSGHARRIIAHRPDPLTAPRLPSQ